MLSYIVPSQLDDKPSQVMTNNNNNLQFVLTNTSKLNGNGIISAVMMNGDNNTDSSDISRQKDNSISYSSTSSREIEKKEKPTKSTMVSKKFTENQVNHSPNNNNINKTLPLNSVFNTNGEHAKLKEKSINSAKTTLKRVSFGSSKGSMVETLIFETPSPDESELSHCSISNRSQSRSEGIVIPSSKVRVSFFDCGKPVILQNDRMDIREEAHTYDVTITSTSRVESVHTPVQSSYYRQESTDSGWDNPFRPDGDLSREADEIVELIKGGKPITPTQTDAPRQLSNEENGNIGKGNQGGSSKVNGNAPCENTVVAGVEVQHVTAAAPTDSSQVEHVLLKKKPKCKCCVVQ